MRRDSIFSKLRFQILLPPLLSLAAITIAFSIGLWVITRKFVETQAQIHTINESTGALLEIARIRGETKEELLLFRLFGEERAADELVRLEKRRADLSVKLRNLVAELEPDEILLESFFAGSEETAHLRRRYLEEVKAGQTARANETFYNYSSLFDINSARLADMLAFLRSRLARSETQIHTLIQNAVVLIGTLVLFSLVGAVALIRFYRLRLLTPLQILYAGLRDVTAGKLGYRLPRFSAPVELTEMNRGFNRMTEELQRTTEDLTNTREQALRAANVKSEFLANMSHEIRTPLNVIIGITNVLAEQPGRADAAELEILQNSGRILLNTVNDILDYSRFECQQVQLAREPFDLRQLLSGVADILRAGAVAKGLRFELRLSPGLPTVVLGDRHRLEQIVLNFANNAIKFTDRGSVTIEAGVDNGILDLAVTDTGIGIAKESIDRLFQRFEQARPGLANARGGTGLGLAIVKQITELMGGAVAVTSTVGQGSRFAVSIPMSIPIDGPTNEIVSRPAAFATSLVAGQEVTKHLSEAKASEVPPRFKERKILVVDDSADNRFLIKRYFESTGAVIREATTGVEAVSLARGERFDVILMDIQMPEMDGYAATGEIRNLEKASGSKPTPIIALTAFALPAEVEKCLRAGCTSHLAKPILKADLMRTIGRLIVPGDVQPASSHADFSPELSPAPIA